ncbi:hypothetical protein HZH66_003976 [Vespula vulgaris]|uniref:Uncharacterized protein n=1 Tax=Vespula vulgaris TaxID=7454 RepID=A0A834KEF8_VESVU|nr:hypothetical protein HZH66_003976 [Vespula vulgaris]
MDLRGLGLGKIQAQSFIDVFSKICIAKGQSRFHPILPSMPPAALFEEGKGERRGEGREKGEKGRELFSFESGSTSSSKVFDGERPSAFNVSGKSSERVGKIKGTSNEVVVEKTANRNPMRQRVIVESIHGTAPFSSKKKKIDQKAIKLERKL